MTTDPSASYAVEVARLLWPEPSQAPYVARGRARDGEPHRDAYVFPGRRRPRLLVPTDVPAAAAMVGRLGDGRSRLARPARAVLQRAVRSRAFALTRWPVLRISGPRGARSIETHLAECFGTEVRVGVVLGTRRVNQKPVLQVFDLEGRLRGFAKIGHNELTAALVRSEVESLALVGGGRPRTFTVPEVLHHGQWSGLEVLVMSALTTDAQPVIPSTRLAAMSEVIELAGTTEGPLAASGFWARLRGDVERLSGERHGPALVAAADAVERVHGDDSVRLGGWHGDWGHWNMGMGDGVLKVWDWERYDARVPVGFDALHYAAQSVRPGEKEALAQEAAFLGSVPAALEALGVPADRRDLTLRLYLLEIAARYVDALSHGATPALTRRTSWVLGLVERQLRPAHPVLVEGRS